MISRVLCQCIVPTNLNSTGSKKRFQAQYTHLARLCERIGQYRDVVKSYYVTWPGKPTA